MSDIEKIVRQMVSTAPPGDDCGLIESIGAIIDGESDKLVERVVRDKYTLDDAKLVDVNGTVAIISPWNVDGLKFRGDGVKFGYDFIENKVIDVENVENENEQLQRQVNEYVSQFYVNGCGVVSVGTDGGYSVVIVGEKLNDSNYYNGRWVGVYNVNGDKIDADIRVKIHYYEDGNVILNSGYKVENVSVDSDVFKSIEGIEMDTEVKILNKVKQLNENKFKNLRRLMPVSRSRIQWGRSIGNYKLGKDAVN